MIIDPGSPRGAQATTRSARRFAPRSARSRFPERFSQAPRSSTLTPSGVNFRAALRGQFSAGLDSLARPSCACPLTAPLLELPALSPAAHALVWLLDAFCTMNSRAHGRFPHVIGRACLLANCLPGLALAQPGHPYTDPHTLVAPRCGPAAERAAARLRPTRSAASGEAQAERPVRITSSGGACGRAVRRVDGSGRPWR